MKIRRYNHTYQLIALKYDKRELILFKYIQKQLLILISDFQHDVTNINNSFRDRRSFAFYIEIFPKMIRQRFFVLMKWKQISRIQWILTTLGSFTSTYRVCTWGILTAMLLCLSSEESKNSYGRNNSNSLRSQGFLIHEKKEKYQLENSKIFRMWKLLCNQLEIGK